MRIDENHDSHSTSSYMLKIAPISQCTLCNHIFNRYYSFKTNSQIQTKKHESERNLYLPNLSWKLQYFDNPFLRLFRISLSVY